jgi:hypothetical protein
MEKLAVAQIDRTGAPHFHAATWRDSPSICSLADAERHLGHVVRASKYWVAFDATHLNETGTGFRILGSCVDIMAAKRAVRHTLPIDCGRNPKLQ